jgi:integrase
MATVKIKYLLKKAGLLYYQRGIPADISPHYSGRRLIHINLKTQDLGNAAGLCAKYAAADDVRWQAIRNGVDPEEAAATALILRVARGRKPTLLSDALERYLGEHKRGQDVRFVRDARRAIGLVTSIVGDLPLEKYTRDHARAVREALMTGHSTATVRRRLDSICAIFNLGRREFDVSCQNPFEKLAIAREGLDVVKRVPFTSEERNQIELACRKMDDDIRHIIAIQLATGARLREIVGLRRGDVILDHEIPHVYIRPHEALGRPLKTEGSERLVPLLGAGLWAAQRALAAEDINGWLFPRYAEDGNIRSDAAAATVNKFFRALGMTKTTHSFRHALKDLFRNSGIPEEMSKAILGHGTLSIADRYGTGFTLQRKAEALASLNPISGEWKGNYPPPNLER